MVEFQISASIKGLRDVEVGNHTSPFNSHNCPMQETDGSWRETVHFFELNEVMTSITDAMLDEDLLHYQINLCPDTGM